MKETLNNTENSNSTKPVLTTVFLAPYLPYKIKGSQERNKTVFYLDTFSNMRGMCIESRTIDAWINNDIKPILKPISDLDKLIKNEFEKRDNGNKYNQEVIDLFCEENGVDELIENIELKSLPYECVEFMFRNHYDFFELIQEGLAISIHDVE